MAHHQNNIETCQLKKQLGDDYKKMIYDLDTAAATNKRSLICEAAKFIFPWSLLLPHFSIGKIYLNFSRMDDVIVIVITKIVSLLPLAQRDIDKNFEEQNIEMKLFEGAVIINDKIYNHHFFISFDMLIVLQWILLCCRIHFVANKNENWY